MNKVNKLMPLRKKLEILHFMFVISILVCPLLGAILLDRGYESLGIAVLFFLVVQLALIAGVAFEQFVNMKRMEHGKRSIEILTPLLFPEERVIMEHAARLLSDGKKEEALAMMDEYLG